LYGGNYKFIKYFGVSTEGRKPRENVNMHVKMYYKEEGRKYVGWI
jgi:hypothetical protein